MRLLKKLAFGGSVILMLFGAFAADYYPLPGGGIFLAGLVMFLSAVYMRP